MKFYAKTGKLSLGSVVNKNEKAIPFLGKWLCKQNVFGMLEKKASALRNFFLLLKQMLVSIFEDLISSELDVVK